MSQSWIVPSEDGMVQCGAEIALAWPNQLGRAWVVGLVGSLGAGKTTLVKGIAAYFGITDIASPTFDLIHTHWTVDGQRLVHMDLYRLASHAAVLGLDLDYYWDDPHTMICIEWPERLPSGYQLDHICRLESHQSGRLVTLRPV